MDETDLADDEGASQFEEDDEENEDKDNMEINDEYTGVLNPGIVELGLTFSFCSPFTKYTR